MALKDALISFEIKKYKHYAYRQDMEAEENELDNKIQPLVSKSFKRIKKCVVLAGFDSLFNICKSNITNLNNFLHIATAFTESYVPNADHSEGQTTTLLTCKYYKIEERDFVYRVALDIEQIASSSLNPDEDSRAFCYGFENKNIERLVKLLDESFELNGKIEFMPFIRRGRLEKPHYLISSDERIMEYDFDCVLFHRRSEFQDIKIISSPSLGNTLLLDNLQNLAEADINYTNALMDRGYECYTNKEILILGGGDGGLLYELLKEKPKFVTMAEIDPVVIEACSEHLHPFGQVLRNFEGDNYKIIVEDCLKTLRRSIKDGVKYDVIFNDLTDIPVCKREDSLTAFEPTIEQQNSPWFFIEAIFNLSMACLKDGGLYMNHATGKGNINSLNAYEEFLRKSRYDLEYDKRTAYVPSFMEIWVFYTVKKLRLKAEREQNYL